MAEAGLFILVVGAIVGLVIQYLIIKVAVVHGMLEYDKRRAQAKEDWKGFDQMKEGR